ncbi:MAG: hypothetical protein DME25_17070, partial [Verrucomicrobia bacterium]
FLRETGEIQDNFTMIKVAPAVAASGFRVASIRLDGTKVSLTWNATPGKTYVVQRAAVLASPMWQPVSASLEATSDAMSWSGLIAHGSANAFYRVVCEGN